VLCQVDDAAADDDYGHEPVGHLSLLLRHSVGLSLADEYVVGCLVGHRLVAVLYREARCFAVVAH
jgi:hypothetical protein